MSLLVSLRTDLLKTKGSWVFTLSIVAAALIPFLSFLFATESAEEIAALKLDPWNIYIEKGGQMLSILFLPAYILLICTLLPQIEYRNNTWKQVLTSPQTTANVFFAKFLTAHLYIVVFFLVYNLLMATSLIAIHTFRADIDLWVHNVNWSNLIAFNAQTYGLILGISGLQFWFGTRFKNFFAPIGIAFCLWLASILMVGEYRWEHANKFPFSYPMLAVSSKNTSTIPSMLWSSAGYMVLFIALAFADFKMRKVKS